MSIIIATLLAAYGATVSRFQERVFLEFFESPLLTAFEKEVTLLPIAFLEGAVGKGDIESVSDDDQCHFPSVPMDGHGYGCLLIHVPLQ
jgi:hypothetical protein